MCSACTQNNEVRHVPTAKPISGGQAGVQATTAGAFCIMRMYPQHGTALMEQEHQEGLSVGRREGGRKAPGETLGSIRREPARQIATS